MTLVAQSKAKIAFGPENLGDLRCLRSLHIFRMAAKRKNSSLVQPRLVSLLAARQQRVQVSDASIARLPILTKALCMSFFHHRHDLFERV
jgi:hypothetical protein